MPTNRFRALVVLTVVAAGVMAGAAAAQVTARAVRARETSSAGALLELDKLTLQVRRASGGDMVGVAGSTGGGRKQIQQVLCEPIRVDLPAGDAASLIAEVLAGNRTYSGAISALSSDGGAGRRRTFSEAMPTEIVVPALDASERDAAFVGLTLQPAQTKDEEGGAAVTTAIGRGKNVMLANFRVSMPGLDTSRVARVGEIRMTRTMAESATGERRTARPDAGSWQYGNLELTLAGAAKDFVAWHRKFVIEGRGGDGEKKSATIELLTLDGQVVLRLEAKGVGILAVRDAESGEAGRDGLRRTEVEMFVESWSVAPSS